jgi:hypothetical protein
MRRVAEAVRRSRFRKQNGDPQKRRRKTELPRDGRFRLGAEKSLAKPKIIGAIRTLPSAWLMKGIPIHGHDWRKNSHERGSSFTSSFVGDTFRKSIGDRTLKPGIQESLPKAKLPRKTADKSKPENNGPIHRFFANLGPGLITGAADDDPSGISTYSVAGAAFGYAPLWTALFSLPLMASVQLMCARLGMVTGPGLAGAVRRFYPRWVLWPRVDCCSLQTSSTLAQISEGWQKPQKW